MEAPDAQQAPAADPVLESHIHQEGRNDRGDATDEGRRDRRSRDRYGRDRRERGDRPAREEVPTGAELSPQEQADAFVAPPTESTPAPAMAPVAAPASSLQAAPQRGALPKVSPFELPIAQLRGIAESSGLQWVNSDAEKIAAAQAAIAAEPKAVHVPRERPPLIVVDEGPLVLVETRKDLRNLQLPFEQPQQQLPLQ
jgi:ribonuclease E